jgi:hypothetical protein
MQALYDAALKFGSSCALMPNYRCATACPAHLADLESAALAFARGFEDLSLADNELRELKALLEQVWAVYQAPEAGRKEMLDAFSPQHFGVMVRVNSLTCLDGPFDKVQAAREFRDVVVGDMEARLRRVFVDDVVQCALNVQRAVALPPGTAGELVSAAIAL